MNMDFEKINYLLNENIFGLSKLEVEPFINEVSLDLSLIIPVYNGGEMLISCLNSVFSQKTSFSYEVIAVNDGSIDNSLDVLKKFQVKYGNLIIVNQENGGISKARNKGIVCARGKYIGLVDNDDTINENYVEKLLNKAIKEELDVVKCAYQKFNPISKTFYETVSEQTCTKIGYLGEYVIKLPGYVWSGIYKRDLFNKVRFPQGFWFEDIIGRSILLREAQSFSYMEEALYYYSTHDNNASKTVWKSSDVKFIDQVVLSKVILDINDKLGLPRDNALFRCLAWELGPMLLTRGNKSTNNIRKIVFIEAANFFSDVFYNLKPRNLKELFLKFSFKRKNYMMWKLSSAIYYKLGK